MLRKIISIRNVGRFLRCSSSGDATLDRFSLVYAENGRGKTTLCAILRSLQSGDPHHIIGRSTLGEGGQPEVRIQLDDGIVTFKDGRWDKTVPELAIFDATFVADNIYAGGVVSLDNRRNLYNVIVGKQGAELAHRIEELDAAVRSQSATIRERRAAVEAVLPDGLSIDEFLALPEIDDIEARVGQAKKNLEAAAESDGISRRAALSQLEVPAIPPDFEELLQRTVADIASDAEHRVREHIEKHSMQERGETWLSEGLGFCTDDSCPFCGQSLEGLDLITAFEGYFGEAYEGFKAEIASARQSIEADFADREIARLETAVQANATASGYWSKFCDVTAPTLPEDIDLTQDIRTLRTSALALLGKKEAAPLSTLDLDKGFKEAQADFEGNLEDVKTYNLVVVAANSEINQTKSNVSAASPISLRRTVNQFQATKQRHEPRVAKVCQDYQDALGRKTALEDDKKRAKMTLDQYAEDVIGPYERTMNELLDRFQAGFRIVSTGHGYPGGVASSSYQLLINDTPVDLGDSSTSADQPSFRNTLSSGDKSALALAFFLAQLEHDPSKSGRVVVFDDPFASQDSFRRSCTIHKIRECGRSCQQVIVLSHNHEFLRRAWESLAPHASERKCIKLSRVGFKDTSVVEHDIEHAGKSRFQANLEALTQYFHSAEGDPLDIVAKIRPVLEKYCRNIRPGEFEDRTLGDIIGMVRQAGASHQLHRLLDDLDALNDYSQRYHHGEKSNEPPEPINETQLQGFVGSCLQIMGGC